MDHMDGKHDDTITCLAMGLFVMQFSYMKMQNTISKDKAILKSWVVNKGATENRMQALSNKSVLMTPSKKPNLTMYSEKSLRNYNIETKGKNYATNLWLFGMVLR